MTSRTGNSAFTLIEVLVASVILFAGLAAVLKAYSLAVVALDASAGKVAACGIIQEVMGDLDLQAESGGALRLAHGGGGRAGTGALAWQGVTSQQELLPGVTLLQASLVAGSAGASLEPMVCEWVRIREPEPPH